VRLGISGVSSSSEMLENVQLSQATPEALAIFSLLIERKELRFSRNENPFVSYRRIPTIASDWF